MLRPHERVGAVENRPLVLVADDQPEITKLVSLSLEADGFRVLTASDGQQALAQLADANPDVLLLDIMMPGMSGMDVLREVRSNHPVPGILLSARTKHSNAHTSVRVVRVNQEAHAERAHLNHLRRS